MRRIAPFPALAALAGLLAFVLLIGLAAGAVVIGPPGFAALISGADAANSSRLEAVIFWQLRLPRVLLAAIVGASLSVAGALMQGLFRNPLADPGLVGVSSGAALGAVFAILFGGHFAFFPPAFLPYTVPMAALAGAWGVTAIVLRLASHHGGTVVATLLLAGIAINAFVGAAIGLATFLATDAQLRSLNFWMLGSLGGASWETLFLVVPFCAILLVFAPRLAGALNAFSLGEAEAGHLGFRPDRVKRTIILLTALGVGGCVAQVGMIGFLGLVVPHLFRLAVGPDHRWLVPGSALLGAALLVASDTLSRTLAAPAEIPVGIVTAAAGAPFFLALLMRQKRRLAWL